MVYFRKPKDFSPHFEAVSCYLINSGKILLLKRQLHKPQGGKWGIPAGKIETGENSEQAVMREVEEETGIKITNKEILLKIKSYVVQNGVSFLWFMYKIDVDKCDVVLKKDEHTEFIWVKPSHAMKMELALDEDICIKKVFGLK